MTRFGARGVGAVLLCVMVAGPALASGYIPPLEFREQQASHAVCIAKMEEIAQQNAGAVKAKTIAEDGVSREVTLEAISKGVERLSKDKAWYQAKLWYANGWPRRDIGKMVYRASWEKTNLTCEGKVLISSNSKGFTSEGFGPLETPVAEAVKP